jgi:nitronate monooxygenase
MLSFGDPAPFAPKIKAAGALLICQVQSEEMARQALDAGADVLIAQGTEAGGHGASRTTLDIVPAIVDLAAGRVPVVAAGGLADGRGLAAMLMLGASGVLMGTRFYASLEADGAEQAKAVDTCGPTAARRCAAWCSTGRETFVAGAIHPRAR